MGLFSPHPKMKKPGGADHEAKSHSFATRWIQFEAYLPTNDHTYDYSKG
jgi:hypothetical protein